jgi:hypothetical protein
MANDAIVPRYPRDLVIQRARQRWRPQSAIEQSQGDPYAGLPGVRNRLQIPSDPGIEVKGWRNPYVCTQYGFNVPDQATDVSVRALGGNPKRCYMLVQNKGPGNLFLSFGTEALANGTNCLVLITTQVYEIIGGGGVFPNRDDSLTGAFIPRDSIYILSDAAATTCMILEGMWTDSKLYR